jgi:hypothetical protein
VTVATDRVDALARAASLGKPKEAVVQGDEEGALYDTLVQEMRDIADRGGQVDLQWDDAGTPSDFLQHLYQTEDVGS